MAILNTYYGANDSIPAGKGILKLQWNTYDNNNLQGTVTATGTPGTFTATTDANGGAEIELPVGTYTVTLSTTSGYNTSQSRSVTIASQEIYFLNWFGATDLTWDRVYPIGSIYMSANNTDPGTIMGGTWVQLKDRFLLGAGDTYTAGDTGGEATHQLTVNEMPSHKHEIRSLSDSSSYPQKENALTLDQTSIRITANSSPYYARLLDSLETKGSSQAHNNMPPYLVVYMWKRTA